MSVEDSTALTQGWAFLAQGDLVRAAERAQAVLAVAPRNGAALSLAVEVGLARAGAAGGLDVYEQWLAGRPLEEPSILRAIALAVLREVSEQLQNPRARMAALEQLAHAGDVTAIVRLRDASAKGGTAEARLLAAEGDTAAVATVIGQLAAGTGNSLEIIHALAKSGRAEAVTALMAQLRNPESVLRSAAAEALGALGRVEAIGALRPLLNDPSGAVQAQAAGALFRLGDASGLGLLYELARSPEASGRLIAAKALSSRPDARWIELVRGLTQVPQAEIRLEAARLLAAHDRDSARLALDGLARDSNVAIRDEAARVIASDSPIDMTTLRGLMRHGDRLVRIAAAGKLLEVTR